MREQYHRAARRHRDIPNVVKLDHAEHPPEIIPKMLEMTARTPEVDVVLGNLTYDHEPALLGPKEREAEEWIRERCKMLGFPLSVGHAHGFQLFPTLHLLQIVQKAGDILDRAGKKLGKPLLWGFDLSMLLAAHQLGLKLAQVDIPGELERNRPGKKNDDQFQAWDAVFNASVQ
jgi:hypothetical protein